MKKIWILNHYATPDNIPGATRHFDIARKLVKKGYEIIIFASSFIHGKNINIINDNSEYKIENYEGIKFIWINTFPKYKSNGIKRFLNMFSYYFRVMKISKNLEHPDIIIGSSVHLLAALAGVNLANKFKAKSITEIRDIWPQTLVDIGAISKYHPLCIFFSMIEKYIYKRTKKLITLLENSIDYFLQKRIKREDIIYIPNGVDIEVFNKNLKQNVCPINFDKSICNFVYAGAHGYANGLDNIIKAVKIINKKIDSTKYKVYFIGNGPEKNKLINLAKSLNISNIEFINQVEKNKIPSILYNADILLFNLKKLDIFKFGLSPNKLFDYMCSGKMIISSCFVDTDLVKKANCGYSIEPDNPELLAEAMMKAMKLSDKEKMIFGKNGINYVKEHHNIEKLAEKFEELFY